MAKKIDIYNATTGLTLHHGTITVNPGGPFFSPLNNGCYYIDTSYADESKPTLADISGKYGLAGSGRFDDRVYYSDILATGIII